MITEYSNSMKNILLKTAMVLTLISLLTACKPEEEALISEPSQTETTPDTPATDSTPDASNPNPDNSLTLVSPALAQVSGTTTTVNLQGFSDTQFDSAEFYFDSQCATVVEQANQNQVSNGGVNVNVIAQASTQIYAALFRNGVSSGCELILTYNHDTDAPDAPTSVQLDLSQISQSQSVRVVGQLTEDADMIELFSDSSCGSQVGSGTSAEFVSQGVQFYYIDWSLPTPIFAQVIDAAGNSSSCQEIARFDVSN